MTPGAGGRGRQPSIAGLLQPGAGTLAVAYLYFWRGEESYGNV